MRPKEKEGRPPLEDSAFEKKGTSQIQIRSLITQITFVQHEFGLYLNLFLQCPVLVKNVFDHFVGDREVAW